MILVRQNLTATPLHIDHGTMHAVSFDTVLETEGVEEKQVGPELPIVAGSAPPKPEPPSS